MTLAQEVEVVVGELRSVSWDEAEAGHE